GSVDIEAPRTENIEQETASGIVDTAVRLANRYLGALAANHVDYTKIADDRPIIALPGLSRMLEAGGEDRLGSFAQRFADLQKERMMGTGIHPRMGTGRW
ncbi:MAG: hypothetical protein IT567_03375, partial [Alphaproteobacteria bacterium]|nr:hypothetical protein [Alphaproteobacteria bacterium]